jgi:hypothetical protein
MQRSAMAIIERAAAMTMPIAMPAIVAVERLCCVVGVVLVDGAATGIVKEMPVAIVDAPEDVPEDVLEAEVDVGSVEFETFSMTAWETAACSGNG